MRLAHSDPDVARFLIGAIVALSAGAALGRLFRAAGPPQAAAAACASD